MGRTQTGYKRCIWPKQLAIEIGSSNQDKQYCTKCKSKIDHNIAFVLIMHKNSNKIIYRGRKLASKKKNTNSKATNNEQQNGSQQYGYFYILYCIQNILGVVFYYYKYSSTVIIRIVNITWFSNPAYTLNKCKL